MNFLAAAKGHQTSARSRPGREGEGAKEGAQPLRGRSAPGRLSRGGQHRDSSPSGLQQLQREHPAAAAAAGATCSSGSSPGCGRGQRRREGRREVTKQEFYWSVSSLFNFLLKDRTGVRCVCGKERGQKISRNKRQGPKQNLASSSGQTSCGNGKRKIGCYCGFSLGGLFRSVDLQG